MKFDFTINIMDILAVTIAMISLFVSIVVNRNLRQVKDNTQESAKSMTAMHKLMLSR